MELEKLRNTWQSVKPLIDSHIDEDETNKVVQKKDDIKSRLLKRAFWDGILTMIFILLMAFSPVWSPMKFPHWWLMILCLTVFIAELYCIRLYRSIKAIKLWENTNHEIMRSIVSIKKLYRNIELATASVIIPLMLWLSFTPFFINSWRMFFTWGLIIIGFTMEYLWYISNVRQLNNLVNWENE